MHDGQNLFNDSTSFAGRSWRCQNTVDSLINQGEMDELIIVGIDNTNGRMDEYTYSKDAQYGGGKGDFYLDFIESTIIPIVKDNYRIDSSVNKYGILGSSLGGLISCYAGWRRNIYNKAGCMSSSFWWNNSDFKNVILSRYQVPSNITFYLDSGDQGSTQDGMKDTVDVRNVMQQKGFTLDKNLFYYLDKGGAHNEASWGNRFWAPMISLYPPPIYQSDSN